jgi:hypothetical protein
MKCAAIALQQSHPHPLITGAFYGRFTGQYQPFPIYFTNTFAIPSRNRLGALGFTCSGALDSFVDLDNSQLLYKLGGIRVQAHLRTRAMLERSVNPKVRKVLEALGSCVGQ